MHTNTQTDLKQLILSAWKERWSEMKWSMHVRKYLHNTPDVFHVADALVAQAFIGSSPNLLLVSYIWYGINTQLFSYAAIITAISKHEDLHKVESTRAVYGLLEKCLTIINEKSLVEDSMDLCCSLRMILQWLLRNTEQYLKGVHDVYSSIADELIRLNCSALEQLTTNSCTSALLTIARFEESGVWSHIETDLAVIKTSAGQHPLHVEISESCHHVSQLSRISVSSCSIYPQKSSSYLCLPITNLLMLEVNNRMFSDSEGIARQMLLLSQIHSLSISDLLFHNLQSCLMGFLDAVQNDTDTDQEWAAMLFLRLPKIFSCLKSSMKGASFDSPSSNSSQRSAKFQADLIQALQKLKQIGGLIDALDQLREGVNWLKSLTELFVTQRLISDKSDILELLQPARKDLSHSSQERYRNPLLMIKAENTVEHLINALNPADFASNLESIVSTFQGMCNTGASSMLVAAAAATGQLSKFANKLIQFNDAMKSSTGENSKTAQVRVALFDITFLKVCQMVRLFGKNATLTPNISRTSDGLFFIQQWIHSWWVTNVNYFPSNNYEPDSNRVEIFIQILRGSAEFKLILTKWNDVCINLPQAVLELVIAKQKGFFSFADLTKSCCGIRDGCPLSVCLATMVVIARNIRTSMDRGDQIKVLEILSEKSPVQSQNIPLYEERYSFFIKTVGYLMGDLLPQFALQEKNCNRTPANSFQSILKDALDETRNSGWINHVRINMILYSYKYLHVSAFLRQLFKFITQETRLNAVENAVDIVYTILRIDLESLTICLMQSGSPLHSMAESHMLAAPVGPALAKMLVACLDIAFNDTLLKQKSLLKSQPLSPFLYKEPWLKKQDNVMKVRRLLSCSTEHDLSSSGTNAGLPADEPLVVVLSNFISYLWRKMKAQNHRPLSEFVFTFIKLALHSTPLLSRTVKQLMPTSMVKELSPKLVQDSQELLFAACDLGNPEIRRIAAEAISHASSP